MKTPTDSFNAVTTARRILRQARTGALATLTETGAPFASLVTVATDTAGRPLILISGLAVHTTNLTRDPRASILLELRQPGDPLQGARVSVSGRMMRLEEDQLERARFLARQPEARGYAGFRDFALWRMEVEGAHLVAGFGRIVEISAGDLLLQDAAVDAVAEAEFRLLEDLNRHAREDLAKLAERHNGTSEGSWQFIGLDTAGVDLGRDEEAGLVLVRWDFHDALKDVSELPVKVKEIAQLKA